MKHLKNLNIFGHPISFQVNDGIIYKSYIGTFVTLIIIASGLYIFIELMKQMYARETPNIVRTEERVDSSKPEEHVLLLIFYILSNIHWIEILLFFLGWQIVKES